jgi:hypothetical protein
MSSSTLIAGNLAKIGRPALAQIPVPTATATHKPVPHHEIVEALIETLGFRHIGVVGEEYAVSSDGMKMFGVIDLESQMEGAVSPLDSGTPMTRASAWRLQLDIVYSCVPTWRSAGTLLRSWRNTARAST